MDAEDLSGVVQNQTDSSKSQDVKSITATREEAKIPSKKSLECHPSNPKSPATPQNKKDAVKVEDRQKLAKERREEKAKYLEQRSQFQAAKKSEWLEKEERARRLREQQIQERRRKLEEQRIKAEKRRAALEDRQKQKLEKNKERYEAAIQRSTKKTWAEIRQQRWSWAGGLSASSSQSQSRCSISAVNLPKHVDSVLNKRLSKSSATLWNSPVRTRRLELSPWESSIVDRLMTPTLSFLARSRSAVNVQSSGKDSQLPLCPRSASVSPFAVSSHRPHRCSERWRVTTSTPDITQRQRQRDSTPMDKNKKEKKDKERENEKEKGTITKEKALKKRQSLPAQCEPRSNAKIKQKISSPRPPAALANPNIPKSQPKRARTPVRVEALTKPLNATEQAREHHTSSPIPSLVMPSTPGMSSHTSIPTSVICSSSAPEQPLQNTSIPLTSPAPSPAKPMAGTTDPDEAVRILTEKRRQAREQREREEQERREQEEREREERAAYEAEEKRHKEEEARLMAEQRRLKEEAERLQLEKEAQEKARAEQERSKRLQRQKEEAEAKAREEAEQQRLEREKHFQKEEQERLQRKKRLEEIMKRTRKTETPEKDRKSSPPPLSSPPQVNGGSSKPESKSNQASDDIVPSTELKQDSQSQNGSTESSTGFVMNGIQAPKHENGLSGGEASRFEGFIQLSNHDGTNVSGLEKSESDIPNDPIMAFDGGNTFLKKTGSMKPQHVAEVL